MKKDRVREILQKHGLTFSILSDCADHVEEAIEALNSHYKGVILGLVPEDKITPTTDFDDTNISVPIEVEAFNEGNNHAAAKTRQNVEEYFNEYN